MNAREKNIDYLIKVSNKRGVCKDDSKWRDYIGNYVSMNMPDKSTVYKNSYIYAAYLLLKPIDIISQDILAGRFANPGMGNFSGAPIKSETNVRMNQELSELFDDESLSKEQRFILEQMKTGMEIGMFMRSPDGHVVPGFEKLLSEGIDFQLSSIKKQYELASDEKKKDFYQAMFISLSGMQGMILNYAEKAKCIKKHAEDELSKKRMQRIENACRKIAHDPPENFFEAVQLICMIHESVLGEAYAGSYSLGRLDYMLYPYYVRDIQTGYMDKEDIEEVSMALWIKLAANSSAYQNVTLGGCNENGSDSYNELTILFLQCSQRLKKDQPQISLRVTDTMPKYVWDAAFSLLKEGMGFPSFFNDGMLCNTRKNMGASIKDARNVSIVGCVEPTVGGKEYAHTEGMRINWLKVLELVMYNGTCPLIGRKWKLKEEHELRDFRSFDEFYNWFKQEFNNVLRVAVAYMQIAERQYAKKWPKPLLSATMEGCLEKGLDVTEGGTVYNLSTVNAVGVASTIDSIEAIQRSVFQEHWLSFEELREILNHNFEGNEIIRKRLRSIPKYGNNDNYADRKMKELCGYFVSTLEEYKNFRKGGFQAGFYTSYFHSLMGKYVGASADGRLKETAMSSSLSPMAGSDIKGPTSAIRSALSIPMQNFNNCMALDLKFTPQFLDTEKHLEAVRQLIEVYFEDGGMEIQFNVVDKETLLKAQQKPSEYQNLIVRVSGYSGYFVALDTILQNEIIQRTGHENM